MMHNIVSVHLFLLLLSALCSAAAIEKPQTWPPVIDMKDVEVAENFHDYEEDDSGGVTPRDHKKWPHGLYNVTEIELVDSLTEYDKIPLPDDDNDEEAGHLETRGTWGGFMDTCRDIRFLLSDKDMKYLHKTSVKRPYLDSPILSARCRDLAGAEHCSHLELGGCMVNWNGFLNAAKGGAFHQSCIQCRIFDTKGTVLTCNCYRDFAKSSSVILSQVTLNKIIHNFDGRLRCFAKRGPWKPCPWLKSYDFELDDGHYGEKADYDIK